MGLGSDATSANPQRHRCETIDAQDSRRARAEIDDASAHVWAAIVDSYRCGAAVMVVDDGHHAAERQDLVRRCHRVGIHVLTSRGDAAVVDGRYSRQCGPEIGFRSPCECHGLTAKVRRMRARERCRDLNSSREQAGKRCCEHGDFERTTMRRVLISQSVHSFVCYAPAMPKAKETKGDAFDLTVSLHCRDDAL
jgi:hypothetical protein